MRVIALLLLAFTAIAAAEQTNLNLTEAACTVYNAKDDQQVLPWPFPDSPATAAPTRKLLNTKAEDLANSGRTLDTVIMNWFLWQTINGKCIPTTKLPPAYVKAATQDYVKVNPGGVCTEIQSVVNLANTAVIKKYAKKCPKSTVSDIYLVRLCSYSYGHRGSAQYAAKLTCKTESSKTTEINVWANAYRNPNSITLGTWFI